MTATDPQQPFETFPAPNKILGTKHPATEVHHQPHIVCFPQQHPQQAPGSWGWRGPASKRRSSVSRAEQVEGLSGSSPSRSLASPTALPSSCAAQQARMTVLPPPLHHTQLALTEAAASSRLAAA